MSAFVVLGFVVALMLNDNISYTLVDSNLRDAPTIISKIAVDVCRIGGTYNASLIFWGPSSIIFREEKITVLPWRVLAGRIIEHLMRRH